MNGYIQRVRQWSAARHAEAAAVRALNARPLEVKIRDYFAALPPHERRTQYTMAELVMLFNAAPGRIGTELHRLGWLRRRKWGGGGSYRRFWIAPTQGECFAERSHAAISSGASRSPITIPA